VVKAIKDIAIAEDLIGCVGERLHTAIGTVR